MPSALATLQSCFVASVGVVVVAVLVLGRCALLVAACALAACAAISISAADRLLGTCPREGPALVAPGASPRAGDVLCAAAPGLADGPASTVATCPDTSRASDSTPCEAACTRASSSSRLLVSHSAAATDVGLGSRYLGASCRAGTLRCPTLPLGVPSGWQLSAGITKRGIHWTASVPSSESFPGLGSGKANSDTRLEVGAARGSYRLSSVSCGPLVIRICGMLLQGEHASSVVSSVAVVGGGPPPASLNTGGEVESTDGGASLSSIGVSPSGVGTRP